MNDPKWKVADSIEYSLLKQNAQENRVNQTEAESAFWSYAKSNGFGLKCRRQYIIGQYIVDFFFRDSLLIIEIDGDYHLTEEQQIEDKIRQNWLEQNGYTVLRFTNNQLLFDIDKTIETIKQYLK